ncbi:MAG: Oxidoreductase, aldo/keto reductase family [uncultured Thermomicrobiales bacterium]|uniref:Oxidoreductase, aldo/keto reductase family n=1 Tax=uncultured Thermomicrobiales bacterium TaxID=1645740 RepID=A0A6J4VMM9_9BACT|nr:MAG: Oxidoreductase, aldo/keto reductase family [uncultured Thermomicrobiales bacterium]
MKIKGLGRTGLKVSEICLGTMTFGNQADEATAFAIMDAADAAGVTFFDTADVYPLGGAPEDRGRTEEIVGRWLRERGARERIVLATKCRNPMGSGANDQGLSRKHVIAACDASLRRLGTDYIDLYQPHSFDPTTPIDETLRALDDLVRAGKVRYIGCSNYPAWRLADALWTSKELRLARFDSVQPRYNLLFRMIEDELLPLCQAHGVGVMAYNPLAGGMLTGRYREARDPQPGTRFGLERSGQMYQRRYWNDDVFQAVAALGDFLALRGKEPTHVALAWVLAQPVVTSAILGASRPEQLVDSLRGVGAILDDEERAACDDVWFQLPRERDPAYARR